MLTNKYIWNPCKVNLKVFFTVNYNKTETDFNTNNRTIILPK